VNGLENRILQAPQTRGLRRTQLLRAGGLAGVAACSARKGRLRGRLQPLAAGVFRPRAPPVTRAPVTSLGPDAVIRFCI